jgi:MoaA/NifB/PqqE/SkfB family radical SAM enzyme
MSDLDHESLKQAFTSTGSKLFWHQEAMQKLRDGRGVPIVSHVLPTDICQHTCAFCSVATREGDVLRKYDIQRYLNQLVPLGLKAVIISGGGNPILYRDKVTGEKFNELARMIHGMGLQMGLITNGMKMKDQGGRTSWINVEPGVLDLFTWIRISMSGLDHQEKEVFVPDIDPSKTTLGFSWVMHDRFVEPLEKNHGKVSTADDLVTPLKDGDGRAVWAEDELPWIQEKIHEYVDKHHPRYVRLLPNCLEPDKIAYRSQLLQNVADRIDPSVVFVQVKPPRQPHRCLKGYPHPVLNSDGFVYPCDSVVLNRSAHHRFAEPWRICHMSDIGKFYSEPIRANVPNTICGGCVFTDQVELLSAVADGLETPAPLSAPEHENFV